MPNAHTTAMAESSRTDSPRDSHSTPNAERIAKTRAESVGLMPRYYPTPKPPKDAWVMPPVINSMRRATMYVPMMALVVEMSSIAHKAF